MKYRAADFLGYIKRWSNQMTKLTLLVLFSKINVAFREVVVFFLLS